MPISSRRTFLAGAAGLASIAIIPRPAGAAQFNWKLAFVSKADHPVGVRSIEMAKKVLADTGGRLDIQVFPNSTLITDADLVASIRSNTVQMVIPIGSTLSSIAPSAGIEGIGFAFTTQDQALKAYDAGLGDVVRKEVADKGMYAFPKVWVNGFRQVTTGSRAIHTAADLAGLKMRTAVSKVWIDLFTALGAAPTPIDASALYTSLQTHVVDGQETPLAVIEADHFYEVQKYVSLTNHMWSNFWFIANADAYHSLPADVRQILDRNMDAAADLQRKDMLGLTQSTMAKLTTQGMIINPTDPASFRAKLKGFYAQYHAQFGNTEWAMLEKYAGKLG
jgi:tripartite ATP-independent transporter DctP family solute receptor